VNEDDLAQMRHAIRDEALPCAVLDVAAFDRNCARIAAMARAHALPLRMATKSLRVPGLIDRLLKHGPNFAGLLCFAVREAECLQGLGHDDLLVAYPPSLRSGRDQDLARAARLAKKGVKITLAVDSMLAIDRAAEEARAEKTSLSLVLDIDMSLEVARGHVHLGVRRSPLRSADDIVRLAKHIDATEGVSFEGLLCYEAQVAGLGDRNPFARMENRVKQFVREASIRDVSARRNAIVRALEEAGLAPRLVNGGGTGSLNTTTRASGVTEVSAGSGFYKPHLFDYFHDAHMRALEPSLFFALEVTRIPGPGWVTLNGGGYIASGAASADKLPLPWWPRGLSLEPQEGAGEVQTPLRVPSDVKLALGDAVFFRHAKAGELTERFENILVFEKGEIVERMPTYRGLGWTFF